MCHATIRGKVCLLHPQNRHFQQRNITAENDYYQQYVPKQKEIEKEIVTEKKGD